MVFLCLLFITSYLSTSFLWESWLQKTALIQLTSKSWSLLSRASGISQPCLWTNAPHFICKINYMLVFTSNLKKSRFKVEEVVSVGSWGAFSIKNLFGYLFERCRPQIVLIMSLVWRSYIYHYSWNCWSCSSRISEKIKICLLIILFLSYF